MTIKNGFNNRLHWKSDCRRVGRFVKVPESPGSHLSIRTAIMYLRAHKLVELAQKEGWKLFDEDSVKPIGTYDDVMDIIRKEIEANG